MVNGGSELLRCEQALWLDGARLAILALGEIEDNRVGVKLGRNITIDWAGGVVLKLRGDKFGRRLGRMISADASLGVVLKLLQGDTNALAMGHADVVIAANERGERD